MKDSVFVAIHGLSKSFVGRPVLRDIELEVAPGTGLMIVGANGSGKSTLLRLIAGLGTPSSGTLSIFGEDSRALSAASRRRIGAMTHQSRLYPNLTARENLEFSAAIFEVKDPRARATAMLERVGLASHADTRVRALSKGMEQRLGAARAMIAEPDLIVFDEPFASLDSQGVAVIAEMLASAMTRGASVVISAHSASSFGSVAFDAITLRNGTLVRDSDSNSRADRAEQGLGAR